jgi:hypothetical protein
MYCGCSCSALQTLLNQIDALVLCSFSLMNIKEKLQKDDSCSVLQRMGCGNRKRPQHINISRNMLKISGGQPTVGCTLAVCLGRQLNIAYRQQIST